MGNAFQAQGRLDDALEAYNKVLSINPDYAEAYNNLGNAFQAQGRLDDALEAYIEALSIKHDLSEAIENIIPQKSTFRCSIDQ